MCDPGKYGSSSKGEQAFRQAGRRQRELEVTVGNLMRMVCILVGTWNYRSGEQGGLVRETDCLRGWLSDWRAWRRQGAQERAVSSKPEEVLKEEQVAMVSDAKDRLNVREAERRNSGYLGASAFCSLRTDPGFREVLRRG